MNDQDSHQEDAELQAMQTIAKLLRPLDEAARRRVVMWTRDKFGFSPTSVGSSLPLRLPSSVTQAPEVENSARADGEAVSSKARRFQYASFAELFHVAAPKTDAEKALVAAAWLQDASLPDGIESFSVNKELKNLGYPVSNITRSFDILMASQPSYIMQLRKTGVSQQARKTYKVTDAGFKRVQNMAAAAV